MSTRRVAEGRKRRGSTPAAGSSGGPVLDFLGWGGAYALSNRSRCRGAVAKIGNRRSEIGDIRPGHFRFLISDLRFFSAGGRGPRTPMAPLTPDFLTEG